LVLLSGAFVLGAVLGELLVLESGLLVDAGALLVD
jgi:hypothetical protein